MTKETWRGIGVMLAIEALGILVILGVLNLAGVSVAL